jgi:hypothetical protein
MSGFILTDGNYYSQEADRAYYSCSQIDAFRECEAKALATLQGRFGREAGDAFLLGQYFHAAMESDEAFKAFCDGHFDLVFRTKETKARGLEITGKYAKFAEADKWIAAAKSEPAFAKFRDMDGRNEVSMHGAMFGRYPFKVRFDRYIRIGSMRVILDWKTAAGIWDTYYDEARGRRVSFAEHYGYYTRAAVYTEIERQNAGEASDAAFFLACVSKQDPPDRELLTFSNPFDRQKMDIALDELQKGMARIDRIKRGFAKPARCGRCDYCRATKRIRGSLNVYSLDPGERPPREPDYAAPDVVPDGGGEACQTAQQCRDSEAGHGIQVY